jgi:hypothetical protein
MAQRDFRSHGEDSGMHPQRRRLAWINVLGGTAVLGSYWHGLATHPATRGEIWGNVPDALRPAYTVSMLLAAAGYFAFTYVFFFRINPDTDRVGRSLGFGMINALYAGILIPSALWLPLTFAMIESPGGLLWFTIRLVLVLVGLSSVGLLFSLLRLRPRPRGWAFVLGVAGCTAFCVQTAVLDALVWPAFFPL